MGFPYFYMEFSTRFPYSMVLSAILKLDFLQFEMALGSISRGLLKNGKNKNVLEIDVEKDSGICF